MSIARLFRRRPGLGLALAAGVAAACPVVSHAGTVEGEATGPLGHRYQVVTESNITWPEARAQAEAAGGYLATIGDAEEQAAVADLLSDNDPVAGAYWFGLRESATEGDYRHLNGATPSYDNFLASQPDNFGGVENSGSILWSNEDDPTHDRRGFWNDLPENRGYPEQAAQFPDLVPQGFLIEFLPAGTTTGDADDPLGTGGGGGNGGGGNGGGGGGEPSPVPLPAAVWAFPAVALLAGAASRRLRRGNV